MTARPESSTGGAEDQQAFATIVATVTGSGRRPER